MHRMRARGNGAGPDRVPASVGATTQERTIIGTVAAAQTDRTFRIEYCGIESCLGPSADSSAGSEVVVMPPRSALQAEHRHWVPP